MKLKTSKTIKKKGVIMYIFTSEMMNDFENSESIKDIENLEVEHYKEQATAKKSELIKELLSAKNAQDFELCEFLKQELRAI